MTTATFGVCLAFVYVLDKYGVRYEKIYYTNTTSTSLFYLNERKRLSQC